MMADQQMIHVYMMGSAPSLRGGMSSVVKQLLQHDWGKEIDIHYIPTHTAGTVCKRSCLFIKSYMQLLFLMMFRKRKIDIFYLHMSYKGSFSRKYLIYKLANAFGKKVLIHLHGSEFRQYYENASTARKQRISELFTGSAGVIVLGEYWRKYIRNIAPEAKVEVVQNAVVIPNQVSVWNSEPTQLLYLGVLIPRKGVKDLLDAMHSLTEHDTKTQKNIRLVISGTGAEMESLQEQCRMLHLEQYVDFVGWVDGEKKKELLMNSQCLILPSYNEGLPVAILEALSFGVPVVSTDVGSIREAVEDGCNGHLIPKHAPDQIAAAVLDIIKDPLRWQEYSRAARQTAVRKFNETEFFERIKTIITSAVNGGKDR